MILPQALVLIACTLAPAELREAIAAYLQTRTDADAARQLEEIVARADATAESVLAALRASDAPIMAEMPEQIPYRNQLLLATISAPLEHADQPRPVVLDISNGKAAAELGLRNAIVVY